MMPQERKQLPSIITLSTLGLISTVYTVLKNRTDPLMITILSAAFLLVVLGLAVWLLSPLYRGLRASGAPRAEVVRFAARPVLGMLLAGIFLGEVLSAFLGIVRLPTPTPSSTESPGEQTHSQVPLTITGTPTATATATPTLTQTPTPTASAIPSPTPLAVCRERSSPPCLHVAAAGQGRSSLGALYRNTMCSWPEIMTANRDAGGFYLTIATSQHYFVPSLQEAYPPSFWSVSGVPTPIPACAFREDGQLAVPLPCVFRIPSSNPIYDYGDLSVRFFNSREYADDVRNQNLISACATSPQQGLPAVVLEPGAEVVIPFIAPTPGP